MCGNNEQERIGKVLVCLCSNTFLMSMVGAARSDRGFREEG